jgi:CheY-like chemotaxis protein
MHTVPRPLTGQLVLIVEDEVDVAQRLAAILQRRGGAQTLLATSIQAARSTIEAGAKPHFIIIDHNLGAEIGTTLARWIRARPEECTKMVSYSAQSQETILASCGAEKIFELILTKGTTTVDELVRRLGELRAQEDEQ